MGFELVARPFALLGSSLRAMKRALDAVRNGRAPEERIPFQEIREDVGFPEYNREEERYSRG